VTGRAIERVLVANRGEIAARVIRACADEGIESVLAMSDADRDSRAALIADRTVCIGPAPAADSYLDVDRVIAAALTTGCGAIHPGYGFLAEKPELPEACSRHGLIFVGPSAGAIRRGGDKAAARQLAGRLGIPVAAGSGAVADATTARRVAERIGYPVVLKASAGGGGKGMVRADCGADLEAAFERASGQAAATFGDGRMYVEHFVSRARHVEVQVLGDCHGSVVQLGERDCSVQRRYQKLVEEAPAVAISGEQRSTMRQAAVALVSELDYTGAATVEFVVDVETGAVSFLEINTRVQVEHPVTEMVTGIDIVREQFRVAAGQPLSFRQRDVTITGHAIEARINAEDPARDFAPSPGLISRWVEPLGSRLRIDTHCFGGYCVPPFYDSLLAKMIAVGDTRAAAARELDRGLRRLTVEGVVTTRDLIRSAINHPDFLADRHHTRWLEDDVLAGPVAS
jgi:acetyl-CoA carboxylase biotin carboxylase subunit